MAQWNAHSVFSGTDTKDGLLQNLSVPEAELQALRAAREEIRVTIRKAFPNWSDWLDQRVLFESAAATAAEPPKVPRPKFRSQGSMAYHTINDPAHEPPQEIDADDGMFLPVSFVGQNGTLKPMVASKGMFELVEAALEPLCETHHWELDRTKPSCVRVRLNNSAHVDVALYAIPDDDYEVLIEKAAVAAFDSIRADATDALLDSVELAESAYQQLPEDHIVLAHRDLGWIASDPRKLEGWFQEAIERHGYQLRRVCRYTKGWRDFTWPKSRLASIALMKCIVETYNASEGDFKNSRDDQALLRVFEALPPQLRQRIKNPVIDAHLDDGWTPNEREEYAAAAANFAQQLSSALQADTVTALLSKLRDGLGNRVPKDTSLVREDGGPNLDPNGPGSGVLSSGLYRNPSASRGDQPAVRKAGGDRYA